MHSIYDKRKVNHITIHNVSRTEDEHIVSPHFEWGLNRVDNSLIVEFNEPKALVAAASKKVSQGRSTTWGSMDFSRRSVLKDSTPMSNVIDQL